jgi:hypothetical protein
MFDLRHRLRVDVELDGGKPAHEHLDGGAVVVLKEVDYHRTLDALKNVDNLDAILLSLFLAGK